MKKNGKQRIILWVMGVLLIGLLSIQDRTVGKTAETSRTETAQTEDVITYNAAEFEPLSRRTKEEAAGKYVEARYISPRYEDTDITSIYEELPSFKSPYSAGSLSGEAFKTMISMCNYFRWLVGSEKAESYTTSHDQLLKSAFCRNFPLKPEDFREFPWCYPDSQYKYSQGTTPLEAIKNAMNEKYFSWDDKRNLAEAYKLRKEIIEPYNVKFTVEYSGEWFAESRQFIDNGNKEKLPFFSFPSQGYMPNDLLTVDKTAWSVWTDADKLTIPTASDKDVPWNTAQDISVTVVHRESGQKFERSMDKGNAYADGGVILFEGPAEEGLSAYTGTYDVEVTGLLEAATGKAAKLCYTVTFFDSSEYLLSKVKEVSIDGVVTYVLPKQMATSQNIEKLTAILPKEVTVTGENGRNVILPVKGKWRYDEAASCWKNSVDASGLPPDLTDPDGVLSDFSIYCEVSDNQEMSFEMNWVPKLNYTIPTIGSGGKIIIKRNPESAIDSAIVYQITKPDEAYTAAIRYDTKSSKGVTEDKENNAFVIQIAYFLEDIGDYAAIGYTEGGRKAWLSDTIIPILVTEWKPWRPDGDSDTDEDNSGGVAAGGGSGGTGVTYSDSGGIGTGNSEEKNVQEENKQKIGKKTNIPKVAKVKKYKVRAKKRGFVLTWKKSTKVSGYQVQLSTKRNFKGTKKTYVKKSKNRYTISKLKPGKKYYIRIRAYRTYQTKDGKKKKTYGKWTIKRIRTLK